MKRIIFERVGIRAPYTHFIEVGGQIVAVNGLDKEETRVGVIFEAEFPTDLQRQAIVDLSSFATGLDPNVEITFKEGTSPFPRVVSPGTPFADFLTS